MQKRKVLERLQQRFDFENGSDFYHCGNGDCNRATFEDALDLFFKCPSCGKVLNLKKNERIRKLFLKKIDQIKQDVRV